MTKLWILLIVSLLMAWVIDNRDRGLRNIGVERRERFVTCMLIIVLGFFCGLRTWGNDTVTYGHIYQQMPLWSDFLEGNKYTFSDGIGFCAVTSLLKTWGFSQQDYLMFYAFATIIPYVLFVRRYSQSIIFGVFLMFVTGFYTFSLAAIKQCMATGLCLMSINYALDRKWKRYLVFVGLATLFHPYALVYLLVPFMMFKPGTYRTFLYIVCFVLAGFFLESLLGTVIDVTTMMGASYTVETFLEEGVNVFRVLVSAVPLLLASMYGKTLFRDSSSTDNLMFNLAMINALIMFVGLFGTANYFARLANYFLPAQVITLPKILSKAPSRDKAWLVLACIVGYLGYFFYENAIIRPFDTSYSHMSLWAYIVSLF